MPPRMGIVVREARNIFSRARGFKYGDPGSGALIAARCSLTLVWDRATAINARGAMHGDRRTIQLAGHLLSGPGTARASIDRRPIQARRDPGNIADVLARSDGREAHG
jgi:hypothetical protein